MTNEKAKQDSSDAVSPRIEKMHVLPNLQYVGSGYP